MSAALEESGDSASMGDITALAGPVTTSLEIGLRELVGV